MWIKEAQEWELNLKEGQSKRKQKKHWRYINVEFREDGVWVERKQEGEWKRIWKELEGLMKRRPGNCKLRKYKNKKM